MHIIFIIVVSAILIRWLFVSPVSFFKFFGGVSLAVALFVAIGFWYIIEHPTPAPEVSIIEPSESAPSAPGSNWREQVEKNRMEARIANCLAKSLTGPQCMDTVH